MDVCARLLPFIIIYRPCWLIETNQEKPTLMHLSHMIGFTCIHSIEFQVLSPIKNSDCDSIGYDSIGCDSILWKKKSQLLFHFQFIEFKLFKLFSFMSEFILNHIFNVLIFKLRIDSEKLWFESPRSTKNIQQSIFSVWFLSSKNEKCISIRLYIA